MEKNHFRDRKKCSSFARPLFIIESFSWILLEAGWKWLKAWPFGEARKIVSHISGETPKKGYVLFETGYGPSGLPHIGTFGEVVRTTMVRNAFSEISDIPSRLFAFSDDMDGMRKIPDNVPNQDLLSQHLDKPLTSVPDPFGTSRKLWTSQQFPLAGLFRQVWV